MANDSSTLINNVNSSGSVTLFGQDYTLAGLSADEALIFASEFDTYFGNSMYLHGLHARHRMMAILTALRIAKASIGSGGMVFKGIKAGPSELGWAWIRPGDIMRTTATTQTPSNVWDFSFTVTGTSTAKKAWVGYGTSNANAVTIDKNCLIVVLGLIGYDPFPAVDEIQVKHGNTEYNHEVVKLALSLADNDVGVRLAPIHTRIFSPTNTVYIATRNNRTVANQQLAIFGITFGKGDFLMTDYRTAVST